MNRCRLGIALVGTLCIRQAAVAELGVGDKAPPLHVGAWVKGEAVDLSKSKPDAVYVVEFWATWCPPCRESIPHLSELQDEFKDKNVTIIGVTDEKDVVVQKFLKSGWDSKMRYHVALDDAKKTSKAWMKASGQSGIPTAFIVKDGAIKWIGHPMEAEFDSLIAKLCGDKDYADRAEKLKTVMSELMAAHGEEDWEKFVAVCDRLLELKPSSLEPAFHKYQVLATKTKNARAAKKWGLALVEKCDDAESLNEFAWKILTDARFEDARDMDVATIAAKKAVTLMEEQNPAILDTYARALADSGDLAGAIEWQGKAVEQAKDRDMKSELKKALRKYKRKSGASSRT